MKITFKNLNVKAISVSLPKQKLALSTLAREFGEVAVKRIIASTGISSVHIADSSVKTSDLCLKAVNQLLSELNILPDQIDAIVFVSQTNDAVMPATSVMMQHRLGMSKDTVAFDINYGCSGYVYGLYQAAMLISSGGCERVLLCAGDVITPLLAPSDHQVRMVFGDAGSATLIERGKDSISFCLKTDGSGKDYLKAPHHENLQMNGAAIMEFALREVPLIVDELLNMKCWHRDEVGTFAFHQANAFMLNYLRKKMGLPKQAVPIAVEDNGNTGSASIPLTLSLTQHELRQENRLDKVVMCGFGVGLSWAATGLNLSATLMLPPVEF